jgi:hypothetical protein
MLVEILARDSYTALSEPVLAIYNPPFTPWFMRRNEVLVDIAE